MTTVKQPTKHKTQNKMNTIKIILTVAVIAAISRSASAQNVEHIEQEIDSLSKMPDIKFVHLNNNIPLYKYYEEIDTLMPYFYQCTKFYRTIDSHIYNAYENQHLGSNPAENLQAKKNLSHKLHDVYIQKFIAQISFILCHRPIAACEYNFFSPTHTLRKSPFVEKNSPVDSVLFEIQQRITVIIEQNQKPE
jgi:hypothetical protein